MHMRNAQVTLVQAFILQEIMPKYHIAQNFDGGNIDGLASFRSLTRTILTDSS